MATKEDMYLRMRIEGINKSRKEFSEELDKFDMFYSKEFIVNQYAIMNKYQRELEMQIKNNGKH